MHRLGLILITGALFVVAACGSTASAVGSASSPTPSAAGRGGGAAGQLVQINGSTLILSGASGDITVAFTSSTAITKTSAATLADIVSGECIVATGTKDSAGLLTARTVRIAPKVAGGCTAPGQGFSPPAGASPRPSPSGQPNTASVAGEVTAVSGTSVTVLTPAGSQTISVPTVATVSVSSVTTSASLQVGQCLRATGRPDASGTVQATALTITPPGANGTCATGRGGFGAPPGG